MDIVKLSIERDTSTKIPVEVFEYEVPILRQLHGPGAVSELSRRAATNDEIEKLEEKYGEPAAIFDALTRKYSGPGAEEAMAVVFPNAESLVAYMTTSNQRAAADRKAQKAIDKAKAEADEAADKAEAARVKAEQTAAEEAAKAQAEAQRQLEKDAKKQADKEADKDGKPAK